VGQQHQAAFTGGDLRMITLRDHPVLKIPIVCTEPSPDEAKAFSSAVQANASGGNGTVTGSVGGGASSAEAIAELAGRSTALLGLRDGLYKACEAYANGAIGSDSYALVLSRYGQLMTTLFLGQDISASAAKAGATATSPTININPSSSGSAAPKTSASGTVINADASGATPAVPKAGIMPASFVLAAAGAPAPAPAPKPKPQPQPQPNANANANANPNSSAQNSPGQSGGGISTAAALALARMNEDYFALDLDPLHILLVACVNEYDPTRKLPPYPSMTVGSDASKVLAQAQQTGIPVSDAGTAVGAPLDSRQKNTWLAPLCDQLKDLKNIEEAEAQILTTVAKAFPAPPINPAVAASSGATGGGTQKAPSCPSAALGAEQKALLAKGFYPGTVDCKNGPKTMQALINFQTVNRLSPTGKLDPATSVALGLTKAPAPVAPPQKLTKPKA
jgi:hypothetical protein